MVSKQRKDLNKYDYSHHGVLFVKYIKVKVIKCMGMGARV